MSDKISLTRAQVNFLVENTECNGDQELAVERFAILMIEERLDPTDLVKVLEKVMRRMKNGKQ